jgi:hypothetical protein
MSVIDAIEQIYLHIVPQKTVQMFWTFAMLWL